MIRKLFLAAALTALTLPAQAQGDRITRANTVISEPGMYFLDRSLAANATSPAIDITASNVTLDLNGYTLTGPGGKQGTGIRVRNAQGVRVTNGKLVNFAFHVMIANSANITVRDLQIRGEGLPVTAPPPETGIMIAQSRGVTIENNNLYNTGLGVFVRGGMSWGNRIVNNTITAGTNGILGICYNPADNDPLAPRADVIAGNHIANFNVGIQMAAASSHNVIRDNTMVIRTMGLEDLGTFNRASGNVDLRLP